MTALQDIVGKLKTVYPENHPVIGMLEIALVEEKRQIIIAYDEGTLAGLKYLQNQEIENGEQYFTHNYEN